MTHLFSTHYSLNSVLTLDKPSKIEANKPVSVCSIAKQHSLERVILCERRLSGFIEAYKNMPVPFTFGWKAVCCESIDDTSDESEKTEHKVVIFCRNTDGYRDLLRIHNTATAKGRPRVDLKLLKSAWTKNLHLAIPFYDSFLHANHFSFKSCFVDLAGLEPTLLVEAHGLPFDEMLGKVVEQYGAKNGLAIEKASSVFYYDECDFPAYLTYRCITDQKFGKRRTLAAPNFDWMCSNQFSYLRKGL